MSCPDTKALLLEDLPEAERESLLDHADGCASCRIDLEGLRLTIAALRSVPDEEVPVRIRFVSDKIFEPRWWRRIPSFALPAFALGIALLALIIGRPARVGDARNIPILTEQQIDQRVRREVDARVGLAVQQAIKGLETRETQARKAALASFSQQALQDHRRLEIAVEGAYRSVDQKLNNVVYAANEKQPVMGQ